MAQRLHLSLCIVQRGYVSLHTMYFFVFSQAVCLVMGAGGREVGEMRQTVKILHRGKGQRVNELLSERALLCIRTHALKPGCFL